MFVLTPMAALALAVTPLSAQVRANVRIDIPILGRNRPVIIDRDDRYDDRRYLVEVREYSSRNHGQWKKEYRKWRPVTLYWVNGRYYERQVRGARAVTVYFYRNQYFFEPRDRDFYRYRDDHRNDRRDDRYDNRDDRNDRRDPPRPNTRYDDRARPRQ
jgi:hypothetical protein